MDGSRCLARAYALEHRKFFPEQRKPAFADFFCDCFRRFPLISSLTRTWLSFRSSSIVSSQWMLMAALNSKQLRPAVHDAVHVQVRVAMYSSLAIFMLLVCSLGAPVAMVTRACRWAYPSVELACSCSCSENRSRARERLQGRSLHAMNGYRRLASITASFTAPGAVSSDHGLLVARRSASTLSAPRASARCSVR